MDDRTYYDTHELSPTEYEWMTGWRGVAGAAYNQVYEFLCEGGLIRRDGTPTERGYEKIKEYEESVDAKRK